MGASVMVEINPWAEAFFMLLALIIAIAQCIVAYYFRAMKDATNTLSNRIKELNHLFFHHRHKECECDKAGKGDVYIPTQWQKDIKEE